jgi:hypothetical protein
MFSIVFIGNIRLLDYCQIVQVIHIIWIKIIHQNYEVIIYTPRLHIKKSLKIPKGIIKPSITGNSTVIGQKEKDTKSNGW